MIEIRDSALIASVTIWLILLFKLAIPYLQTTKLRDNKLKFSGVVGFLVLFHTVLCGATMVLFELCIRFYEYVI